MRGSDELQLGRKKQYWAVKAPAGMVPEVGLINIPVGPSMVSRPRPPMYSSSSITGGAGFLEERVTSPAWTWSDSAAQASAPNLRSVLDFMWESLLGGLRMIYLS